MHPPHDIGISSSAYSELLLAAALERIAAVAAAAEIRSFGLHTLLSPRNRRAALASGLPCSVHGPFGYAGLGDVNHAEKAFVAAIKINQKSARGHYSLGVLHEQNGDVSRAEADYKNSIAADRGFENAYLNLGALCANQRRFDEAIDWLQRLLKINPSANDARAMCSSKYGAKGRRSSRVQRPAGKTRGI